jgi:hypothetical protein
MYKEDSDNQRNLKTKNVILALEDVLSAGNNPPTFVQQVSGFPIVPPASKYTVRICQH